MVVIRSAYEDDAAAVAALLQELGYPTAVTEAARRLALLGRSEVDHVLVAVMDIEVTGLVSITIAPLFAEGGSFARITSLVVGAHHRNAGVGRALVGAAERLASQAGCRVVQVSSGLRPEREAAHRFYAGLGYADASRHHTLYEKPQGPSAAPR